MSDLINEFEKLEEEALYIFYPPDDPRRVKATIPHGSIVSYYKGPVTIPIDSEHGIIRQNASITHKDLIPIEYKGEVFLASDSLLRIE